MEYAALFVWLVLCLLIGAMVHHGVAGATVHKPVRLLVTPGMFIRKFSMAAVALLCGATLTRANMYSTEEADVSFEANGVASVAKVLAPLAPLFGCAVAFAILNSMFGRPLRLNYAPPELSSLDTGGVQGFLVGTWRLLSAVVERGARADWGNPRLYVLLALSFSLALGAAVSMERAREAALGAALVAVVLALLCSISIGRTVFGGRRIGWALALRNLVVHYSAVAFVMMIYGMTSAVLVGVVVRAYELFAGSPDSSKRKRRKQASSSGRAQKAA